MTKYIEYVSAGGVVIHDGKMLLLDRPARSEVRLPKGHVEEGETTAETALRETTEESGYADLTLFQDLGHRLVEFDYKNKHYRRTEHYYLMRLDSTRQVARDEHDTADFAVLWVPCADAVARLTYESEQAAAQAAIDACRDLSA